jgi:hypothetical protein
MKIEVYWYFYDGMYWVKELESLFAKAGVQYVIHVRTTDPTLGADGFYPMPRGSK